MKNLYFNVRIQVDNDSFARGGWFEEIPKILRGLADRYQNEFTDCMIVDSNGNRVGKATITVE